MIKRLMTGTLAAMGLAACTISAPGLPTPSGSPSKGPGGTAVGCPGVDRAIAPDSTFTIKLEDADGKPISGVKVTAVKTIQSPKEACPPKLKENADATSDAAGKAAFFNMAAGSYFIRLDDEIPGPPSFKLEKGAPTWIATKEGARWKLAKPDPTLVKRRADQSYVLAKDGIPETAKKSYTIETAEAAKAFAAWLAEPEKLQAADFTKERLVALYDQPINTGCYMGVAFRVDGNEIKWAVEGEPPPGMNCSPMLMPSKPYWGVAAIPAGAAKVRGTEVLVPSAVEDVPANGAP